MHETFRRPLHHDSRLIVRLEDAGDVTVDLRSHLFSWLPADPSAIAHQIVKRCSAASTLCAALRPRVPHGLRALTPPALRLSLALARWASKKAVDVNRDEAYFRNISLVPHGTPSTSSDVERFGMTLESLVPTVPDSDRLIRSRWL